MFVFILSGSRNKDLLQSTVCIDFFVSFFVSVCKFRISELRTEIMYLVTSQG